MSKLTLSSIAKRFGSTSALDDVSLDIHSGEFICLLGASGCGKTTLLRIIAGLETQDKGEIALDGNKLDKVPCHRRNIGMVFQSLALFHHLDVGDNIAYGLKMRGVAADVRRASAEKLLETVDLAGLASRSVSSLSGGQRQRVAIARALALEPHLFLMDEPFSALDAGLRDHLQLEVKKLQQRLGVTTIFVTHDQREAMALADRIVILNNGQVEQAATPAEIYQQPASRYVAEFVGTNNLIDVDVSPSSVKLGDCDLGAPQGVVLERSGTTTLAIRPEAITLSALKDDDATSHLLSGTIVMQRQVGALVEHEIEVDGLAFRQTAFQNSISPFGMGDRVSLSFDWNDIWALPA